MSHKVRKVSSASAFLGAVGVATLWASATFSIVLGGIQLASVPPAPTTVSSSAHLTPSVSRASKIDTTWRLTKNGWQDSTTWSTFRFAPDRSIERLHPVIWATIVCLSVIATVIWASSEWEIARLIGEPKDD